jgi:hypothetical protein
MYNSTISITSTQEITLHLQCLDNFSCPMDPPDTPSWSNSDNTAATITPAEDNLSCLVTAVAPGFTDVTVTIDSVSTTTRIVVPQPVTPVLTLLQIIADAPVAQ